MRTIDVQNRTNFCLNEAEIEKLVRDLGKKFEGLPPEISVVFVPGEEIKRLNERYYGREGLTDVLTFPYEESAEVVLCPKRMSQQAEELANDLNYEFIEVLAHGLLHLAGYDHTQDRGDDHLKKQRQIADSFTQRGTKVVEAKNV